MRKGNHIVLVRSCELIDTLWNVNENVGIEALEDGKELIDTLWNVNTVKLLFLMRFVPQN